MYVYVCIGVCTRATLIARKEAFSRLLVACTHRLALVQHLFRLVRCDFKFNYTPVFKYSNFNFYIKLYRLLLQ